MPTSSSCGSTRCAIPTRQRPWPDAGFPVIVTCRPRWEGGFFDGSEDDRLALLRRAWEAGAEYVDVEHAAPFAPAFLTSTQGRRLVLSMHDFDGVPRDLGRTRLRHARRRRQRSSRLRCGPRRSATRSRCSVCSASCPAASSSRSGWGCRASPRACSPPAPGRAGRTRAMGGPPDRCLPPLLRNRFRFRTISRRTAVYGVVGRPIAHSLSPAMHNAAFAAEGIDAVYLPLEAADPEDFLAFARAPTCRARA